MEMFMICASSGHVIFLIPNFNANVLNGMRKKSGKTRKTQRKSSKTKQFLFACNKMLKYKKPGKMW